MKVYILATCRKPELLSATTLVFHSLRIGFPTAHVVVDFNRVEGSERDQLDLACDMAGVETRRDVDTIHHKWIEQLIESERAPFWIVDTDLVFYEPVEHWKFDGPMAGRLIPQWANEYAGCIERPRLHTSLMWLDPVEIRKQVKRWKEPLPGDRWTPMANLINPLVVPMRRGITVFHDCTCLLYQAVGGVAFNEWQLDAFTHMNFGTIEDEVIPRIKGADQWIATRRQFVENPQNFRGEWRKQEVFYRSRKA